MLFYVLAILAASWPWKSAGRRPGRRISRSEEMDARDIDRIVVAINRTAMPNRQAALASAASADGLALLFAASLAAGPRGPMPQGHSQAT